MTRLLCLLIAMWVFAVSAQDTLVTSVINSVSPTITLVSDTARTTSVATVFSQCDTVKTVLGLKYGQNNNSEPDLSHLTLDYISSTVNATYNLTSPTLPSDILNSSWLDYNQSIIIFIHGFTDDPHKEGFTAVNSAFRSQGYNNILALDASSLIRWFYLRASTLVRYIGEVLGKVIASLVEVGLLESKFYLVGHSLGAHIASFAGKTVTNITGSLVARITGLDPAGPCYDNLNYSLRLQQTDAFFVDAIHTDAGVFGTNYSVGHADFFPNKGADQPGCVLDTCSHSRVVSLYAESITTPESFIGVSCDSWESFKNGSGNYNNTSVMGFACPTNASGNYYLQTASASPYGLGTAGMYYTS